MLGGMKDWYFHNLLLYFIMMTALLEYLNIYTVEPVNQDT